jgi:hypothetical protein
MAKRRVGVECSPSILEPVRPGAVSPDRALCLPTFSHFVIVNKTSLSLSLYYYYYYYYYYYCTSLQTPHSRTFKHTAYVSTLLPLIKQEASISRE